MRPINCASLTLALNQIKKLGSHFSEAFSKNDFAEATKIQKKLASLIESLLEKLPIIWEKFEFKEYIKTGLNIGTVLPLANNAIAALGRNSSGGQILKIWPRGSDGKYRQSPSTISNQGLGVFCPMILLKEGYLITGHKDGHVLFYDGVSGKYLCQFQCKTSGDVKALLETKTGDIAVATGSGMVEIWNVNTEELIKKELISDADVTALLETKDGRLLSGNEKGYIETWDKDWAGESTPVFRFRAHKGKICAMVETLDGMIATAGDGQIRLWNGKNGQLVDGIDCMQGDVKTLIEDPDGNLITGGLNGAKVWSNNPLKLIKTLEYETDGVTSQALVDKETLITGDSHGYLCVFGPKEKDGRKK